MAMFFSSKNASLPALSPLLDRAVKSFFVAMTESIQSCYRRDRWFFLLLLPLLSLLACSALKNKNSANRPAPSARPDASASALMQLRENVADYAQEYIGTKYHYAGTSPNTGFDCSGFTSFVLKSFDVRVSPSSATQSTQGDKIPLDEVKPGDLVFFGNRGRISHVALVVDRNAQGVFVVHSTTSRGVMVDNISTSKYWKPKIMFARDVISKQNPF
jgi:cell wall-associated NlpC family hydrolase